MHNVQDINLHEDWQPIACLVNLYNDRRLLVMVPVGVLLKSEYSLPTHMHKLTINREFSLTMLNLIFYSILM